MASLLTKSGVAADTFEVALIDCHVTKCVLESVISAWAPGAASPSRTSQSHVVSHVSIFLLIPGFYTFVGYVDLKYNAVRTRIFAACRIDFN